MNKAMAFGGVVLDARGRILLIEPRNHFGGMVWTFPKGRPNPDETPEQTAIREVAEETGVTAEILAEVPGSHEGDTTTTRYFLMRAVRFGPVRTDETESVRWAAPSDVLSLIAQTTNGKGRARDQQVLAAALTVAKRLHLV